MSEEILTDDTEVPSPAVEQSSEPTESHEEEAVASTEGSEPSDEPKKGGVQKKIDKLTRQRYEAEQRAREIQIENQRLQSEMESLRHTRTQADQKPRLEDFDYDNERYAEAVEQWAMQGVEEKQKQIEAAQTKAAQDAEFHRQQQKVQEQAARVMEKHPDFMLKVAQSPVAQLDQINSTAYQALIESDLMGEMTYYLANNPAEVYEMAALSPIQAVKAIAKLETRLQPAATNKTNAPPPPTDLPGRADTERDLSSIDNIDEWMAERNRRRR